MLFRIIDRFAVLSLLPEQGDFLTLLTAKAIRSKVEFTLDEATAFGVRSEGENVVWDTAKDTGVSIVLSEAERCLLKQRLIDKDTEKALTPDHLDIYKHFVLGEG